MCFNMFPKHQLFLYAICVCVCVYRLLICLDANNSNISNSSSSNNNININNSEAMTNSGLLTSTQVGALVDLCVLDQVYGHNIVKIIWGIFCKILLVPQNIIMDLNNVMSMTKILKP